MSQANPEHVHVLQATMPDIQWEHDLFRRDNNGQTGTERKGLWRRDKAIAAHVKELTREDCYLCGQSPGDKPHEPDRVNSDLPYAVLDNLKSCCRPCNRAKNCVPLDVFLSQVACVLAKAQVHQRVQLSQRAMDNAGPLIQQALAMHSAS